jgi:hypothetical protein
MTTSVSEVALDTFLIHVVWSHQCNFGICSVFSRNLTSFLSLTASFPILSPIYSNHTSQEYLKNLRVTVCKSLADHVHVSTPDVSLSIEYRLLTYLLT